MSGEWQTLPPELRQAVTDTIEAAPPPRSVEEVKAMLESTEKGGVRNSIQNCLTVFQYDPELSGAVAKNLLTERIDLLKPIGRKRRTDSKAIAYSVLDHMTVNDAAKGLRELSRIVRKDGLLVLAFDSLEEDDLELAHTVMPDGSLLYTQGKRTGMILHPFKEQELSELLDNKEILYRRTNTKGERVLVVRNSPAVYK